MRFLVLYNTMLLLLLLLELMVNLLGERFDIPPGWFDNQPFYEDNDSISWMENTTESFHILKPGGKKIVSDNRNFSLARTKSSSRIYLLLHMNHSIYPLTYYYYYSLFSDAIQNAISLELENSGNVKIHLQNGSVWESFDFPRNFMLPTQSLTTGMALVDDSSSTAVIIQDEGLFWISSSELSYSFSQGQQYQAYKAWRFNSTCEGSTTTLLHYTGSNLILSNECEQQSLITSSESATPLLPFVLFDSNGNFSSYKYKGDKWTEDIQLVNSTKLSQGNPACKFCPQYGVCDTNTGSCNCLEGMVIKYGLCQMVSDFYISSCLRFELDKSYFQSMGYSMKHKFPGVGYFQTEFMHPSQRTSSLDECTRACFHMDCSRCMALIFNSNTMDCFFLAYDIYGSFYRDNTTKNITLIIKTLHLKHQQKIYIISLTMVGIVIFLCFVAVCALFVQEGKLKFNPAKEIETLLASMQGRLPQRFSYTALDTATKGYSMKLGSGGYGSVYKGILSDGRIVAVKKLDYSGTQGAKQFVTEIAGIGGISHVNIVKLCGFCIEGATQWLLVYEFMPNGSLDKWLFNQTLENLCLSWQQRIDIALGTAQGLAYLHEECREPILHLDIKPQNILLDKEFVAKVADFGMAKLLENRNETQVMTTMRGTPGYMAPEWLTHFMATKRCDVYSYGKVLLELIGGRRNIDLSKVVNSCDNTEPDESWYFPTWVMNQVEKGNLLDVVDERVRVIASEDYHQVKKMVHLALWCIQDNADARPSMRTIVEVLQGHLDLGCAPLIAKVAFR